MIATKTIQHEIRTTSDTPIYVKNYRFSKCHKEQVSKQIKNMLNQSATKPNKKLYLDVVGSLPETRVNHDKFILTLQDDLAKYSQAQETAQRLMRFISHYEYHE